MKLPSAGVLLAGTLITALLYIPASSVAQPPADKSAQAGAAVADPDRTLGNGWKNSSDLIASGVGDVSGYHVMVAREKEAFAWTTLATLFEGTPDGGSWIGETCVTGSGRYVVAVYAPATYVNKPALITRGAYAAIIDIASGAVTTLRERVQLAYFNPGCGVGDRVLLTRSADVEQSETDLIAVDAANPKNVATTRIKAQLTNQVAAKDGDYGIVRGALTRIGRNGELTSLGEPGGRPFAVKASASAIDILSVQSSGQSSGQSDEQATALRYNGKGFISLGKAPKTRLDLFSLAGGRNVIVGDVAQIKADFADLALQPADAKVRAVSRQGGLLAYRLSNASSKADSRGVKPVQVSVQSTRTRLKSQGTTTPALKKTTGLKPVAAVTTLATSEPLPTLGQPKCAVPRNTLNRQVLQPSANQVEWATDLAVTGDLNVLRPTDYLKTGAPSYRPQTMFAKPANVRVPAQIMLAILAQETNMAQASWHAVPGDAGNPLVSDYYGSRAYGGYIDIIDYSEADCGYGVGQVTDGMHTGDTMWSANQRTAIAVDYAANIAASLRILASKWAQVVATGSSVNNGDPQYIENWFLAVWGYNSGVYQNDGGNGGHYGVGWLNNPANPSYPANRDPFLRTDLDDASHPADWGYPEKIMGWAETPQWQWIDPIVKYSAPLFGEHTGGHLTLPPLSAFCGSVNHCTPGAADPCPNWDSTCWWHGHTDWIGANDPVDILSIENRTYTAGSAEPELIRVYPAPCVPINPRLRTVLVVDDLTDTANNVLGCPYHPWGGKFTLRPGYWSGSPYYDYANVDLHQIGSGYLGHMWFAHQWDPGEDDYNKKKHQVIGTWTPDIRSAGRYDVVVHLPSHGANANVYYELYPDFSGNTPTCQINQDTLSHGEDVWVYLGTYNFVPGGKVQLSNIKSYGGEGEVDVGYDAMAFVLNGPNDPDVTCGTVYPGQ